MTTVSDPHDAHPCPTVANPPQQLRPGVTVGDNGEVCFALFAPWKQSVSVFGSFNDWNPEQYPLAVSDQGLWWTTLTLPPGEHHYQYRIDAQVTVCDPYATRIAWDGASNQPHAILRVGTEPYSWNDGGYQNPPFNELVLYELYIGDFSPEGTFRGVIDRLDYLAKLGINAIELMPVQEFPGDRSWGYNPIFYFVPEVTYGTPEDLKELIDKAHQRGIAVLLDLVLEHTGNDSPFALMYPAGNSPWLADPNQKPDEWGMYGFDLWKDASKEFVHDVQAFWLNNYHVDGFRFDALHAIGYDSLNGASYLAWDARQSKSYAYLIGEQIPEDPYMIAATELNAGWHKNFHDQLLAMLCETEYNEHQPDDMEAICRVLGADGYQKPDETVKYLESHDEDRIMLRTRLSGQDDDTAVQRSKLGAQLLMTAGGLPMLWMGQEFGQDSPKTLDRNTLVWDKLGTSIGQDLCQVYAGLIGLHRSVAALHSNQFDLLHCDVEKHILSYARTGDDGSLVVVIANLRNETQATKVPFPAVGRYHEFIFNFDRDIQGETDVELPPSSCNIFVKVD